MSTLRSSRQQSTRIRWTDLKDDVSQEPQVSVSHGPGPDQNLRVVAVMPLVINGHDDPAETGHGLMKEDTCESPTLVRL